MAARPMLLNFFTAEGAVMVLAHRIRSCHDGVKQAMESRRIYLVHGHQKQQEQIKFNDMLLPAVTAVGRKHALLLLTIDAAERSHLYSCFL